ncbi:MAG: nucleotidyltransferase family protein [Desulfovibrio sp.]|jgi:molybdenum cofactor cytidylyltransferase|nr:nucleotidyltransferase family protein [Desulfovibrio sp.]
MPQASSRHAGLILAAGAGTRLGRGKLLLPWRGKPLIAHALEKILNAPDMQFAVVVTGYQAPALRRTLKSAFPHDAPFPLRVAHNPDWQEGQSTSLQCGIRALLDMPGADLVRGVLILLGDMPLVREETLRLLCDAHGEAYARNKHHAATVPAYQGQRGNPVILSPLLFPALFTLRGDAGARTLLPSLGENLLHLPVSDEGVIRDIDSPEDYTALP